MPETAFETPDRVSRPLRLAARNAALALGGLAPFAVAACVRYWSHLDHAPWHYLALIPLGVVAVCFAHAFVAARIGLRRANNIFVLGLFAALATGLIILTRHTSR